MARILIVGGGSRGRRLAESLLQDGYVLRMTTRDRSRCGQIERMGAECILGDPNRLATLRGALDGVTVACWLLAGARGEEDDVRALHGSRLEFFLGQAVDTTVRGLLYEASPGILPQEILSAGTQTARRLSAQNVIPCEILTAPLEDREGWQAEAMTGVLRIMGGRAE